MEVLSFRFVLVLAEMSTISIVVIIIIAAIINNNKIFNLGGYDEVPTGSGLRACLRRWRFAAISRESFSLRETCGRMGKIF